MVAHPDCRRVQACELLTMRRRARPPTDNNTGHMKRGRGREAGTNRCVRDASVKKIFVHNSCAVTKEAPTVNEEELPNRLPKMLTEEGSGVRIGLFL
mmetsp:Transcript_16729/g.25560  ORF Transcript_16729/g.25560 Transcript_16729/m.25560 type:complete len:97 (+) Transcript_16729:129-419(+)